MPEQVLHTKEYETIYILRSDVDADTAEKVQARINEVVDRETGKLLKVEAWGRRKLAYPVAKQKKGIYVYVKYVGKGGLVQEIERNLNLQESVLKFQTVRLRENVDVASLTIDPEEIKFARLELPPEEEERESRERALGLVEMSSDHHRSRREERNDEEFTPEEPEANAAAAGAAAPAAAAPAAAAAAPAAAPEKVAAPEKAAAPEKKEDGGAS